MTSIKCLLPSVLLAMIIGCTNENAASPDPDKDTATFTPPKIVIDSTPQQTENPTPSPDIDTKNYLALQWDGITVYLPKTPISEDSRPKGKISGNNINLKLELGEELEGKKMAVRSTSEAFISITQHYETSVSIMDEGPHCDLLNWKHYISVPEKLENDPAGYFTIKKYSLDQRKKFPDVSMDELRAEVRKVCDANWAKLVANTKSPNEYPSGVGLSKYIFNITAKKGDLTITKTISIISPLGD